MKYTEHYQLNQWDAADRVLREDFNADNAKLDAALGGLQTQVDTLAAHHRLVLLHTFEAAQDGAVTVPMPAADWSALRFLHLLIAPNVDTDMDYELCLNGTAAEHTLLSRCNSTHPAHVILFPLQREDWPVSGVMMYGGFRWFGSSVPYRDIQSFVLTNSISGAPVLAGTRMEIYAEY